MLEVSVSGDISKRLEELIKEFPDKIEECVKNAAFEIEREAKQNIASDATGNLRRSITTNVEQTGEDITAVVSTNVSYAPYYHEGTGIFSRSGAGRSEVPWVYYDNGRFHTTYGIKPHPFLEEAANNVSGHLEEFFENALEK